MNSEADTPPPTPAVHKRRPRYSGKNPRRFDQKYKELNADQYPQEVAKVLASGKTPAGQHVPIMVTEVLECLAPQPGEFAIDCTLGYGGHSRALWQSLQPGGHLLSLDADPIELERTEARLRAVGMNTDTFTARRCNFAGLAKALSDQGWLEGADVIFADLGLSSMQIDNPARGFTFKHDGPLDMRLNPQRGKSAAEWLAEISIEKLTQILIENADEPRADLIARHLYKAGQQSPITRTKALAETIRQALPRTLPADDADTTVRRVFQAIRILVNEEFTVLDGLLRALPAALKPGGRVAILTFHSGEDRRVKKAFQEGRNTGLYAEVTREVVRASLEEQRQNPRSCPAKLRWAIRAH
ncbi:16S rRNA (cytosine1402-N4)-methyltransferase [Prosthecobacter fusiformis]|uniref:Ribosomal RNA small subunit methyltransferase H n=1 Tax=Prosthecobacter fusiformis TaxID=48464 RepID=A0A4R7SS69_9BACT|nr:16S rRNA (cytosine(1402)-N(4))-methyltransferase RsmH [Prosthecobacter fusiformis]TDU81028.1 16S rRNA (cytosine1402-N4)-methyltransferase [Prosthecobacter fusiformis]